MPQRSRRYSVDVTVGPRAIQKPRYRPRMHRVEPEDLSVPATTRATHLGFEKPEVSTRETEEPIQQQGERQIPIPDPLRHRSLHRWGDIVPAMNRETYVSLGLGLTITNEDLHGIVELSGSECWYSNEVLEAAVHLTCQYYNTEANKIGLLGPNAVQSIRFIMLDDDMGAQKEYIKLLEDKDYVFLPINSGMVETTYEGTHGYHWSLLAIDRRKREAWYIDGYESTRTSSEWRQLAWDLATAVGKILGEKYQIFAAENPPDQYRDNSASDSGPCGPYVSRMFQFYIKMILDYRRNGLDQYIELEPKPELIQKFRQTFNSENERWSLVYTLASVKASQVARERAMRHDEMAVGEEIPPAAPAPFIYDPAMFSPTSLTCRQWNRYLSEVVHWQGNNSPASSSTTSPDRGVVQSLHYEPLSQEEQAFLSESSASSSPVMISDSEDDEEAVIINVSE